MMTIEGTCSTAICYGTTIREEAVSIIREICSHEFARGRRIMIMPDVHPSGRLTVTGFTMTLEEPVVLALEYPAGCGVRCSMLEDTCSIDFHLLDEVCHLFPASGGESLLVPAYDYDFSALRCYGSVRDHYLWPTSLGILGGGNHFIELDRDEDGHLYLVVHNGLGALGVPVLSYYLDKVLSGKRKSVTLEDTFLYGKDMDDYLHDMEIITDVCRVNRRYISDRIISEMGWKVRDAFDSCHHHTDRTDGIIRHGAVPAHKGQRVIIPVNAMEGTILGVGKGNPEWNYSAPHGGGRILSRREAREKLSLDEYRSSMQGVYTTTVSGLNIDEAPAVYKSMDEIARAVSETVEIRSILRPLYNYKGA